MEKRTMLRKSGIGVLISLVVGLMFNVGTVSATTYQGVHVLVAYDEVIKHDRVTSLRS